MTNHSRSIKGILERLQEGKIQVTLDKFTGEDQSFVKWCEDNLSDADWMFDPGKYANATIFWISNYEWFREWKKTQ